MYQKVMSMRGTACLCSSQAQIASALGAMALPEHTAKKATPVSGLSREDEEQKSRMVADPATKHYRSRKIWCQQRDSNSQTP
jgi:hypothetical protein